MLSASVLFSLWHQSDVTLPSFSVSCPLLV